MCPLSLPVVSGLLWSHLWTDFKILLQMCYAYKDVMLCARPMSLPPRSKLHYITRTVSSSCIDSSQSNLLFCIQRWHSTCRTRVPTSKVTLMVWFLWNAAFNDIEYICSCPNCIFHMYGNFEIIWHTCLVYFRHVLRARFVFLPPGSKSHFVFDHYRLFNIHTVHWV